MSGQNDHPHISDAPFTPIQQQQHPTPFQNDLSPVPIDIDDNSSAAVTTATATMPTFEELQQLAAAQSDQLARANDMLQQQQQQMVDAQAAFDRQQEQLRESAEAMRQQQQTINQLSSAFQTLTTTTAAPTTSRKKPELPPFDQQNILVWLRRIQAAYDRAGVTQAKDKFAYMESVFDTSFNPIINDFLFNSANTDNDWNQFIAYMKLEYGPTTRQKARKLIGDLPRNSMKPSQYLAQLEEETKDVTLDDVKKEHLLKTIPPRIREILGKTVETKTAKEVAKAADDYFDSQGRPLEKSATSINNVVNTPTTAATAASSPFTSAFEEDSDVNHVKKSSFKGSRPRSQSRPRFNSSKFNSNSTAATSTASLTAPRQQQNGNSLCRFHRLFGDQATKCVSDCPRHSSFLSQQGRKQQQGNAHGGRRL